MKKRILNDIKDFWNWRDNTIISENFSRPESEDMPKAYPCAVVWFTQDETSSMKGNVYHLFVYATEILGI